MILKAPLPLLTASLTPYFYAVNSVFAILPYLPNFSEIFYYLCQTLRSLPDYILYSYTKFFQSGMPNETYNIFAGIPQFK